MDLIENETLHWCSRAKVTFKFNSSLLQKQFDRPQRERAAWLYLVATVGHVEVSRTEVIQLWLTDREAEKHKQREPEAEKQAIRGKSLSEKEIRAEEDRGKERREGCRERRRWRFIGGCERERRSREKPRLLSATQKRRAFGPRL